MKIALFASGTGSNVKAILDNIHSMDLGILPQCLVCDRVGAPVIQLANEYNLPVFVLSSQKLSRSEWEVQVLDYLSQFDIDYIILAGFMRLLTKHFIDAYRGRILNIHPSLLPKYPGTQSIKKAYEAKDNKAGVTIFYVDEGMDTGKIIAQESINVDPNWTLADLEKAIHSLEHLMYTQALIDLKERREDD